MNQVFISGRLTKDPELQQSKGGKAYARVSVAVDRGYSKDEKKRREDAGEQTTDFFQVVREAHGQWMFIIKKLPYFL